MIGREDFDECPKCHNIGIQFQRAQGLTAATITAKWCDCPLAKRYIAGFRSQAYPKARIALLQRDFFERMAQIVAARDSNKSQ